MNLWDTLKRKHAFHIILLTGIAVLVIHVLLNNRYGKTAVLYVAVPHRDLARIAKSGQCHFSGQVERG